MRGLDGAVLLVIGLLGASAAHSREALVGCGFEIGHSRWQPTDCTVDDESGTLAVRWPGAGNNGYLVRLSVSQDGVEAEAAWSGFAGGTHSTEPLGMMRKDGNCWFNATARLCFTREANASPPSTRSARERELDGYYPCAAHRSLEDKERLNDYANATKNDPCTVTSSRQELDELADQLEIAQEVEGDEQEAERAMANEAGEETAGGETMAQAGGGSANASSFRGLQLGMSEAEIVTTLPSSMQVSRDRPQGDILQMLEGFAEGVNRTGRARKTMFIVSGQQACGEVGFVDGRADRLRLYQCFFDIGPGMTIEDFAQQITDNYQLEDGMAGRWEMRGDGPYRFKYTEYAGVRRATSERFTASHAQMNNILTLTVERIQSATFN